MGLVDSPLTDSPTDPGRLALDVFVGGRVTMLDSSTNVTTTGYIILPDGTILNPWSSKTYKVSEDWVEPFIGTRLNLDLTHGWEATLRGDIGGFSVSGSQFSWQVIVGIGYRWHLENWSVSAFAGYRALRQDYTNGSFEWKMIVHGPMLGLQVAF